jgi:hypothetical protein
MAAGSKLLFLYAVDNGDGTATLKQATAQERVDGHVHERDFEQGGAQQPAHVLLGDPLNSANSTAEGELTGTKFLSLGASSAARMILKEVGTPGSTTPIAAPEGTVIDDFLNQQRADPSTPGKLDEWFGGPSADGSDGFVRPGADVSFTYDYGATDPHILINSTAAGGTGGSVSNGSSLGGASAIFQSGNGTATLNFNGLTGTAGEVDVSAPAAGVITLSLPSAITNLVTAHTGAHDHTLLHTQDADTKLNEGGSNEVTAAELRALLENGSGGTVQSNVFPNLTAMHSESMTIPNPVASVDHTWMIAPDVGIEITGIKTVLVGDTTPTVDFQMKSGTDRSAAGNSLWIGGSETATSTTTVQTHSVSTMPSAGNPWAVSAGQMVWMDVTGVGGNVNEFHVTLEWRYANA